MALTSTFLRTWLAVQPSLGDGYLGMQKGEPVAKAAACQQTPDIQVISHWDGCRSPGVLGIGKALEAGLCPFLGDSCLAKPLSTVCLHSTGPQAHPGDKDRKSTSAGDRHG